MRPSTNANSAWTTSRNETFFFLLHLPRLTPGRGFMSKGLSASRNSEGMAKRVYPIEEVYATACRLACIDDKCMAMSDRTPAWAYMSRAAVVGALYELCEVSQPEIAKYIGVGRSTIASQIQRFNKEWFRAGRRAWLEMVITGMIPKEQPEIEYPPRGKDHGRRI